mmetsp:Transcript_6050/g.17839  ORF Transcript_6050/g.17839 Transcript_6050/m.17839 type:complete len:248 (-) Transcript_6050:847-1590(-)
MKSTSPSPFASKSFMSLLISSGARSPSTLPCNSSFREMDPSPFVSKSRKAAAQTPSLHMLFRSNVAARNSVYEYGLRSAIIMASRKKTSRLRASSSPMLLPACISCNLSQSSVRESIPSPFLSSEMNVSRQTRTSSSPRRLAMTCRAAFLNLLRPRKLRRLLRRGSWIGMGWMTSSTFFFIQGEDRASSADILRLGFTQMSCFTRDMPSSETSTHSLGVKTTPPAQIFSLVSSSVFPQKGTFPLSRR